MAHCKHIGISLLFIIGNVFGLGAQAPSNDNCENAIVLDDVTQWCSGPAAFSLNGATPSTFNPATCSDNDDRDIWFSFTARATSVTAIVRGDIRDGSPRGSLRFPEIAIYSGNCGDNIAELECRTDIAGAHVLEISQDGLIIGLRYFIRVDSRGGNVGDFELCVSNFNLPAQPTSDCATSALLCNKEPFTVQSVTGAGTDNTEMDDAVCFQNSGLNLGYESNSTWFTWIAKNDGTLEFLLSPISPNDDLDFVVYELPDGNCANKILLRCMASGLSGGNTPIQNAPCIGMTGLAPGNPDIGETAGCSPGDNNFLAPLDMTEGTTYALVVNNFSTSGNGFEISFGGSGEFLGPEPNFTTDLGNDTVCIGDPVMFIDSSTTTLGTIVDWNWTFGPGSTPSIVNGAGPHNTSYDGIGVREISLTVETDLGCRVTALGAVVVEPCCKDNPVDASATVDGVTCPDLSDGAIQASASGNYGPFTYLWEDGSTTSDISGVGVGPHLVTITNSITCDSVFTFEVIPADPVLLNENITMPQCNGGMDGAIQLNLSGAQSPYQILWEDGSTGTGLINLAIDTYSVSVTDALNCEYPFDIWVDELQLELTQGAADSINPSCAGLSDGSISIAVNNGTAPYQYSIDNGALTGNGNFNVLSSGVYQLYVEDNNLCTGDFTITLEDPPAIVTTLDKMDISCNGEDDGSIAAMPTGGAGGFSYNWAPVVSNQNMVSGLTAGTYFVTITDANGCDDIKDTTVIEPARLGLSLIRTEDVVCFGDQTGIIEVLANGGTPDFQYRVRDNIFQSNAELNGIGAGRHTIEVMDVNGCIGVLLDITINQPPELTVDLITEDTVKLGNSTTIDTDVGPFGTLVTYQWSPSEVLDCDNCPSVSTTPANDGLYQVTITDEDDCTAVGETFITVNKARPIFIPNAISPNFNGNNDFLGVYTNQAAEAVELMQVYDRWGTMVYEVHDLPINDGTVGWDGTFEGKDLNAGVYVYLARIRFIDQLVRTYKGSVTIVR